MIPKLASNLLHFNLQRVAAAVQTQTTQTLRNVLQFQPQAQAQAQAQSVAPSTTATSLGWNAANGAAGTGAGPGGAKFNAGSGFYNAFQSGTRIPDATVSSAQHDDEDKNGAVARRPVGSSSLHRVRRNTLSSLLPRPQSIALSSQSHHHHHHHLHLLPAIRASPATATATATATRQQSTLATPDDPTAAHELSPPPPRRRLRARGTSPPRSPTDPASSQSVRPPELEIRASSPTSRADKEKWIAETVRAAKAGNKDRVLYQFDELRRCNVRDSDMWSATLHSLLQLRQPGESLDMVVKVYNSMLDRGISPTTGALRRLIQSLAYRDIEIHKALEYMDRWEEQNTPGAPPVPHQEQRTRFAREDNFAPAMALIAATYARNLSLSLQTRTYDNLLECCAYRADVKSAIQVYAHMEREAVKPDAKTFAMMLRTYAAAKDLEGAIEVFSEFRVAARNGKMIWDLEEDGQQAEQATDAAKETVIHATEDGSKPLSPRAAAACTAVWNAMIRTYFECNNPAGALALLEKMMDSNVGLHFTANDVPLPSGQTFGEVIRGFIDTGDIQTGLAWFKRLLEQTDAPSERNDAPLLTPSRPNRGTWHAILHGLYQNKMAEEVNELVVLAESLGHPDTQLHLSHWNWVWRTNLVVMQDPTTSKERGAQLLDFIRKMIVESELQHEAETPRAESRIWQCIGLYVAQRRIDEALELLFLAYARQTTLVDQTGETGGASQGAALTSLDRIRNMLRSFEASVLDTASIEGGCFPSFPNLLEYLTIYDQAGLMPSQRAGWYYLNALLHHHEQPMGSLPEGSWPRLASMAVATCQSVFWEAQAPVADANHVWQIISFLQIVNKQSRGFESLGNHNVHRIHQILRHHLGEARTRELYGSLGARFTNVEDYLPHFVKVATGSQSSPQDLLAESRPANFMAPPVPLRIDVAATKWIAEGSAMGKRKATVTPEIAFERLETCIQRGQGINPEELGRLITLLGQNRRLDQVRQAYYYGQQILASLNMNKAWQSAGWFSLEDAMVCAMAHCGDMDAASVHRARIVAHCGTPSPSAYGALIANIKETTDNASVATELFEEARRMGVRPNEYMFNTYISRLSRARKTEQALAVFAEFKERGLVPTMVTYGAILSGCARVGDTVNAEALFQEMITSASGVPRIPPFNTMMQMYVHVKPNRERALHYFSLLKQYNVPPTSYTYKLLIDAYGTIEPVDIPSVDRVLKELISSSLEINGSHFAAVITAHGCANHDLDSAMRVFDDLSTLPEKVQRRAVTRLPDVLTYEAILNAVVSHHRFDLMERYWKRMQTARVQPTAYIYNILIRGFSMNGKVGKARLLFESMSDPVAGAAAPNNHTKQHRSNDTRVYREPSTWEAMVRAELGAGERDRANAIVARAKERAYPSAVVARINGVLWERATSVDEAILEELSSGNESGSSSPPAQTPSSSSGPNSLP